LRFDPDECFDLRVVGLAALPRVWTLLERVGEAAKCALGLHLGGWELTYENESVQLRRQPDPRSSYRHPWLTASHHLRFPAPRVPLYEIREEGVEI
jgi:hypothetical protein